jgi:hypothetical protein
MEPFSPQDPIRKLLGQAREVEVRPNFTQNVVRMARQTPQDHGWLASLRAWWEENTLAGGLSIAGGAVAALALAFVTLQPSTTAPQVAGEPVKAVQPAAVLDEMPILPESEAAWESPLHTEALFAVEDSSQFTDSEISFLLY